MDRFFLLQRHLLTMDPMHGPLLDQQLSISAVCNRLILCRLLAHIRLKFSVQQT